jgi:hypothetical protein
MIIGLSGYAKSGKDTVAEIIQELQPDKWEVKKFSGKLKQIASILTGIPAFKFEDQHFKSSMLGEEWWKNYGDFYHQTTVRDFLQVLGTDAIRNGLHSNAWVNALMVDYHEDEREERIDNYIKKVSPPCSWIVTDVRFPNEAEAIKDRGGVIIRIDRPGVEPVNAHPSETALDNWDFDYRIANASDLVALKQTVEVLLNKIIC